jgi:hypothetical protein
MMRVRTPLLALLAAATLAACGGDSAAEGGETAAKPAGKQAAAAKPGANAPKQAAPAPAVNPQEAAATNADVQAALNGLALPTQAEADAEAEQKITDENADAEYQKLLEELGGEAPEPADEQTPPADQPKEPAGESAEEPPK